MTNRKSEIPNGTPAFELRFLSSFVIRNSSFHLREVFRLLDCKSGVNKYVSEATNWSVTSTSHHLGLVAQPAERPVVCGRVEGATPFGSANFQILPRDRFQG